MQVINSVAQLRKVIQHARDRDESIGFVPTMGNLHAGHISLVDEAKKHADFVIASIFINPMQFGANEDIESYPRTLEVDQEKLIAAGTDLLFTPTPNVIYPKGLENQSFVEVPDVSAGSCGESRPGHFRGVSTVVCKLFNIVQPDVACFGLKDYQQVQVIRTMVEDLSMPIKIIPVETMREPSGLAMSSRNGYLTEEELAVAPKFNQALRNLASKLENGEQSFDELLEEAKKEIDSTAFETDYINICHARTLAPAQSSDKSLVILAAAHLGKARLIDNIQVEL